MSATHPQVTLTWANKHTPPTPAPAAPALAETFTGLPLPPAAPLAAPTAPNALYHGDNLPLLAHLLAHGARGRFRLIYADPPYNSGLTWTRKVRRRGPTPAPGEAAPGPTAAGGTVLDQQPQYADAWDESAYLQFLYARLPLLRDLLADDGSLWLHCDHRHAHHLRCLLEEVFGPKHFLNTITWRSQTPRGAKVNAFYFANSAHTIHVFAKDRTAPTSWTPAKKTLVLTTAQAAAEYMRDDQGFFRTSDPGTFSFESLQRLHAEGRLYAPYGGEVVLDPQTRRAYCTKGGNLGVKYYLLDLGGGRHAVERAVDNIWDDIPGLGTTPHEDLGYPTQKTEALLTRVVTTATQPGDWVLDPFMGSGTTLAVAQNLGRRWVGMDVGLGSLQTTRRRLYSAGRPPAAPPSPFAVYTLAPTQPVPTPPAPPPSAPPPLQVHLLITPIDGHAARIRVTVGGATWPPAERAGFADWRCAVDCIAIDPAYDGHTLRVAVADAPRKRTELVAGEYVLPVAALGARLAVRVTDIWGAEGLAVHEF